METSALYAECISGEEKRGEKEWEHEDGDHTQDSWGFLVLRQPEDAWLQDLRQLFPKAQLHGFFGARPTLVLDMAG